MKLVCDQVNFDFDHISFFYDSGSRLSFVKMDRVLSRVLSLPLFDDEFASALLELKFDCVEKFVVLEVKTGGEFLEKILIFPGVADSTALKALVDRSPLCSALVEIINNSKTLFLKSAVSELGFAHSMSASRSRSKVQVATAVTALSQEALCDFVVNPAKKPKFNGALVLLSDQEREANTKWSRRLQDIGDRAGLHAKINLQQGDHVQLLSAFERDAIKKLVLSMGSFRTLQVHVRHWERWEEWLKANTIVTYPVRLDAMQKYALYLKGKGCGPTVIPSFLTAVNFVSYRLAIDVPDTCDVSLKAIVGEVVTERGKEIKEALPFPHEVVMALELAFMQWHTEMPALAIFTWWVLIMIYGSLRFDDACHVAPKDLVITNEGLFGIVWQTKTERKRKGTKFAVPLIGATGLPWLETGWELFQSIGPKDRDFFIPEINTVTETFKHAPTYARSLAWLKLVISRSLPIAVEAKKIKPAYGVKLMQFAYLVTWHSCRVTLLALAVVKGEVDNSIGLQANWKDPGPMVMKYARNRKQIALKMVSRLITTMKENWDPESAKLGDVILDIDDDTQNPDPLEFFVKNSAKISKSFDLKFHVKAQGFESTETACKKLELAQLVSVGSVCPDVLQICKDCKKNRPDLLD